MTHHGPFTVDTWRCRSGERHCRIALGETVAHQWSYGFESAELAAWREMAVKLAQVRDHAPAQLGELPVPVSPPQSMGITP